jgi:hypothetical protein
MPTQLSLAFTFMYSFLHLLVDRGPVRWWVPKSAMSKLSWSQRIYISEKCDKLLCYISKMFQRIRNNFLA